ncbi:MAG: acyltransferase family protein [Candidatus Omnitrophota bacterium]
MPGSDTLYPTKYYPFLDGLRALSIIWVISHHILVFFDPSALGKPWFIPVLLYAKMGMLGVDMFFVISGFLITGLLLNDLENKVRLKRFYLRRMFKIIPSYLLAVLGGLLVLHFYHETTVYNYGIKDFNDGTVHFFRGKSIIKANWSLVSNYLLFIQNYKRHLFTLAHTWSIAVEEHFYLGYPLILWGITAFIKKISHRRIALVLILLLLTAEVYYYRFWCIANMFNPPFQTTLFRIDALIFGCLLRIFEPAMLKLFSGKKFPYSLMALFIGLAFYCSLFLASYINYSYTQRPSTITLYYYAAYYLAPGFVIISALLGFKPLLAVLQNKFLIGIGKQSYGTYLWHYVLILPFISLQKWVPSPVVICLYFGCSLLVGFLSTITVERYFLNLRRKWAP